MSFLTIGISVANGDKTLGLMNCFEMKPEIPAPPEPLTPEEEERISHLTDDEIILIDDALCSNTTERYRKAAMIIGLSMMKLEPRIKGVPDLYYLTRLKKLVERGLLEVVGDLDYMRFSEVRLPSLDRIQIDTK